MNHNITVEGGSSVRLKTAGKYCDRDIVITATGDSGGVGNLTKYAKIVATPASSTSFAIDNPFSENVKRVLVQRLTDVATSSRKCQKFLADFEMGAGYGEYLDTSGIVRYVAKETTGTPNNGEFGATESKITLYRYNASNTWDNTAEYEVEIYA